MSRTVQALLGISIVVFGGFVAWRLIGPEARSGLSRFLTGSPETLADEEVSVPSKSWRGKIFELNRDAEVELAVTSDGEGIDVYLLDFSEYDRFEKANQRLLGGEFNDYAQLRMLRVKDGSARGRLPPGKFVLVIQNSTGGILSGPTLTVHLKATVQR